VLEAVRLPSVKSPVKTWCPSCWRLSDGAGDGGGGAGHREIVRRQVEGLVGLDFEIAREGEVA
jgi:hypothetical protein